MNIAKHPILKQCYEMMGAIEECGASEKLTHAVALAGELMEEVDKLVDSATAVVSSDEYGWLVEGSENGRACWLKMGPIGFEWVTDSFQALRFSRKEDAEAVARFNQSILPDRFPGGIVATDHIWSDR